MLIFATVSLVLAILLFPLLWLVGFKVQFSKLFEVVYTILLFLPLVAYVLFIVSAIDVAVAALLYQGVSYALTPLGLSNNFRDLVLSILHHAPPWVWFFGTGVFTYAAFCVYNYRSELRARYGKYMLYLPIIAALFAALSIGGILGSMLSQ